MPLLGPDAGTLQYLSNLGIVDTTGAGLDKETQSQLLRHPPTLGCPQARHLQCHPSQRRSRQRKGYSRILGESSDGLLRDRIREYKIQNMIPIGYRRTKNSSVRLIPDA